MSGNNSNKSKFDSGKKLRRNLILVMLAIIRTRTFSSSCLLPENVKVGLYKNVVLPVVLHGCEICSLTLVEGRRLRVFENRVLRRIFGPKRDEVKGGFLDLSRNFFFQAAPQLYSRG
jgi:hypothetical protein